MSTIPLRLPGTALVSSSPPVNARDALARVIHSDIVIEAHRI